MAGSVTRSRESLPLSEDVQQSRWPLYARRMFLAASVVFFLATLGAGLWSWVGPPTWGPLLRCPRSTYNCGKLPTGEVRKCVFLLQNEGRQKLTLLKVISNCGCIVTDFDEGAELEPGASIPLRVQLDSTGMRGRIRKDIAIQWGPGETKPLVLTVIANVESGQ